MKKKQINKIKVQVFEENELREKLKLNQEQITLVLNYQERFPELLQNEKGFCVDARVLWEQLGNPYGKFADWINKKVLKVAWTEKEDYVRFLKIAKGDSKGYGNKTSNEFKFTLDMAKQVSMMENSDPGKMVRKYFILIEKALKDYEGWANIRGTEKDGYNIMRTQICNWCERKGFDSKINTFYTREANLINESLLGLDAIDIKHKLKASDSVTRNHLDMEINKAIKFLQELNCSLLFSDMSFEQRSEIIKTTCINKYADLKDGFSKIVA